MLKRNLGTDAQKTFSNLEAINSNSLNHINTLLAPTGAVFTKQLLNTVHFYFY